MAEFWVKMVNERAKKGKRNGQKGKRNILFSLPKNVNKCKQMLLSLLGLPSVYLSVYRKSRMNKGISNMVNGVNAKNCKIFSKNFSQQAKNRLFRQKGKRKSQKSVFSLPSVYLSVYRKRRINKGFCTMVN